jgi:hypothetical protein
MMTSVMPSAVKGEFFQADQPDIRSMHDNDFLKSINGNFGMLSPIDKSANRPANAYDHNLNLTMELQRMVNEHLRMEDYEAEPQPLFGEDEPMAFGEAPELNPFNDFGELDATAATPAIQKRVAKKQVQQIRA